MDNMPEEKKTTLFERFTPILLLTTILLAFAVGVLWTKVSNLEKGKTTGTIGNVAGEEAPAPDGKLTEEQAKKVEKVTDSDHIKGNKDAEIMIIEYSDLECPFCKRFHETMKQALEEYNDKVAWVYRHFPLDTLHSKADKEAEASECAFEIGGNDGFWSFIDKIFEVTPSNNGLDMAKLSDYASQVGIDGGKFKTCLDSGKYVDKVEKQYQSGATAGITGTPGSFIVNKKGEMWLIPGALPFESLKSTINEALQ